MVTQQCEWLRCHMSSTNDPIVVPSCPGRGPQMSLFTPDALRRFTTRALVALDVPEPDAALVADSLVEAELEGQPSHGLLRLPFAQAVEQEREPEQAMRRLALQLRLDQAVGDEGRVGLGDLEGGEGAGGEALQCVGRIA